jgi:two-component system secretion response regulator SsrB
MDGEAVSCVLLADRHHGLAEGLRGLLESAFGSAVMLAGQTSLIEAAGRLRPDVVVADLALAQDHGPDWLSAIRERCPGLKVIVLSVHDEDNVRRAALKAGADAFVVKRDIATCLLAAVDAVRGGRPAEASTSGNEVD